MSWSPVHSASKRSIVFLYAFFYAAVHDRMTFVLLQMRSERLAKSKAAGQRQKEACSINKSLSSLGARSLPLST